MNREAVFTLAFLLTASLCQSHYVNTTTNAAFNQPATQSGTYGGRVASRAVDGRTETSNGDLYCAIADTSDPGFTGRRDTAWWQVDLTFTYNITSVTVYSDDWRSLIDSEPTKVYVSTGSDVSDDGKRFLCNDLSPSLSFFDHNESISDTINCTQPRVGRYVTIVKLSSSSPTRMTLCEVEVHGYRFYYCVNCNSGKCNSTHGCSQCNPGYEPPSCTNECSWGYYGINCAQKCPPCLNTDLTCNKFTGECPPCDNPMDCSPSATVHNTETNDKNERTSTVGLTSGNYAIRSSTAKIAITVILFGALQRRIIGIY